MLLFNRPATDAPWATFTPEDSIRSHDDNEISCAAGHRDPARYKKGFWKAKPKTAHSSNGNPCDLERLVDPGSQSPLEPNDTQLPL